jgi:predicted membrane channel-forming protein YqfA (hemolysin III family)
MKNHLKTLGIMLCIALFMCITVAIPNKLLEDIVIFLLFLVGVLLMYFVIYSRINDDL